MIVDEEVQEFLEHYGVKGMRWGARKASKKADRTQNLASNRPSKGNVKKAQRVQRKADWKNRPRNSNAQKAGIAAVAAGSAFVAIRFASTRTSSPALGLAFGGAAALAGKRVTQQQMAKYGKTPVSQITS